MLALQASCLSVVERRATPENLRRAAAQRRQAFLSFQAAWRRTCAAERNRRRRRRRKNWLRPCRLAAPLPASALHAGNLSVGRASICAGILPAQLRQRAEGGGAGAAGRPQGGRAALSGGGQRGCWCGSGGGAKPRRSGHRSPRIQAVRGAGAARERAECPDRLAAR